MESRCDFSLDVAEKCGDPTSPSQLQQLTMDPCIADLTSRSDPGVVAPTSRTMKEYEEQVAALRKDNFNLKLRVYFLEERLEASAPHSTLTQQNLTMQNIELKVSNENLRREVTERKELLCIAARALELVETAAAKREAELLVQVETLQQERHYPEESIAPGEDSVALYTAAFNLPRPPKKPDVAVALTDLRDYSTSLCDDKKSELASEEKLQLEQLKNENTKACQMVQGCLKRIAQMEKDNEILTASLRRKEERVAKLQCQIRQAELQQAQTELKGSDQLVQELKQILEIKDTQIKDLEEEVVNLSSQKDKSSCRVTDGELNYSKVHLSNKLTSFKESVAAGNKNIEEMLSSRLQEMAYFLDSLLSHRCILGEEKRKKVEHLLEQSLELPVGLKFDPSASRLLEDSFMDQSFGGLSHLSHTFRLEDITTLLGHHDTTIPQPKKKPESKINQSDIVQQQEILIEQLKNQLKNYHIRCICLSSSTEELDKLILSDKKSSDLNKLHSKKKSIRGSHGGNGEQSVEESEGWSEPDRSVSLARMSCPSQEDSTIQILTREKQRLHSLLEESNARILQLQKDLEYNISQYMAKIKEQQGEISVLTKTITEIKADSRESAAKNQKDIERLEMEKSLLKQQVEKSESRLSEMTKVMEEEQRQRLELADWQEEQLAAGDAGLEVLEGEGQGAEVELQRCASPDQGIDSDRLSSLEHSQPMSLREENSSLRKRLTRVEEQLKLALARLQATRTYQGRQERAICHQIHKTASLLRQVRGNITQ